MRTSTFVAVIVAALPVLAWTQSAIADAVPAYNPPEKTVAEMLQAKSEQSWKDWQNKDEKAYGGILGEGFVAVLPDGNGPRDKASTLEVMKGMTITNHTLSDFKVTSLGPTAELVTYKAVAHMTIAGNSGRAGLAVAEVWAKSGHDWKLVHYQETEVK